MYKLANISQFESVMNRYGRSFPSDISDLEVIKDDIGGSNRPKMVKDKNGQQYILKQAPSHEYGEEALRNEIIAGNTLRRSGARVPEQRLYKTDKGTFMLSKLIKGSELGTWWKRATQKERAAMRAKLLRDYPTDMLLISDDLMTRGRNIIVDEKGNPWRIDNGHTLLHRWDGRRRGSKDLMKAFFPGYLFGLTGRQQSIGMPKEMTVGGIHHYLGSPKLRPMLREISRRDWTKALKKLPPVQQEVMAGNLGKVREIQRLIDSLERRGVDKNTIEQRLDDIGKKTWKNMGMG